MAFALPCLLVGTARARQGVVETREGQVYAGHVRLESNRVVVANAAKDLLAFIDLTNLAELTFWDALVGQEKPPPTTAVLTEEWQDEDIGSVRFVGSATNAGGVFRLTSSGTNIFGQSDSFHFAWRAIKGDSEIVARVLQVQYTAPWAKAGLMMREGLTAEARNVFLGVTPVRLGVFQWRDTPGEVTNGEIQRDMAVPNWIRLRRQGNTFTAFKSRNGLRWTPAGRIDIPMAEEILVGLAVAGVRETRRERGPFQVNRSIIDSVREAPFLVNESYTPAVELQSGSVVLGRIDFADERQIHFAGQSAPAPLSILNVAKVLFRWLPDGLAGKISLGRPGVLLTTGEFIEGDFKGIERGQVKLSSVLLGVRSFDVNNDVIAVVLRKAFSHAGVYEVKTQGGSTWVGASLQIDHAQIILQERSMGAWRIPIHEVAEVRRRANAG